MIHSLRRKLVLGCMLVVLAVLICIIGGLNLLHGYRLSAEATEVLTILCENGGHFPQRTSLRKAAADAQHPSSGNQEHDRARQPDWDTLDSPELAYTTRYFSVLLEGDQILSTDTDMIAAVDAQDAVDFARKALETKKERGYIYPYSYLRCARDGQTMILFLDSEDSLESFRRVLLISLSVSILGYIVVFILVAVVSGRIIRPISVGYEKQKRFITNAGHEIKTPITIINADMEILEMEKGSSEWIDDVRQQTARLASLTKDLIFLSRMEEDPELVMAEIPFSDLVAETANSFQALARTADKRFSTRIEPMLSCIGDSKQLCQLVGILLDNALKYSDPGGSICLILEKQVMNIRLTVVNSVESISEETLSCMFDRFYRGDPSRSTSGYGIGLSIAKAIAEAHKGKLSAAAPDSKTLRMTLILPGKNAADRH